MRAGVPLRALQGLNMLDIRDIVQQAMVATQDLQRRSMEQLGPLKLKLELAGATVTHCVLDKPEAIIDEAEPDMIKIRIRVGLRTEQGEIYWLDGKKDCLVLGKAINAEPAPKLEIVE